MRVDIEGDASLTVAQPLLPGLHVSTESNQQDGVDIEEAVMWRAEEGQR